MLDRKYKEQESRKAVECLQPWEPSECWALAPDGEAAVHPKRDGISQIQKNSQSSFPSSGVLAFICKAEYIRNTMASLKITDLNVSLLLNRREILPDHDAATNAASLRKDLPDPW